MKVIGLTGGTGAGKTTVLREIEALGGAILDCDRIYYEMLETDGALRQELTEAFGDVFSPDGALDRKKLAGIVFSDEKKLRKLNGIVYYYMGLEIRRRLVALRDAGCPLAGIDAINLIESGLGELCDTTVAVTAPEEARLARIMARDGISREYALSRIRAQKPEAYFRRYCRIVLENDGSAEKLREKAQEMLKNFMEI